MLSAEAAEKAAALIWSHWQAGTVIVALPADCRPATRAEGYGVQVALAARSTKPLFGWKIAATSAAGQAHINVDGPIAGRLLAERAGTSGATLSLAGNRMRVAEPEFAFRMGADCAPRAAPYALEEVMARVAALHPAIEVPDSRFSDFTRVGAAQLIADNACAHQFILGPAAPESWRALDLARHPVAARSSRLGARDGAGDKVLGDPRLALAWLVNEVTASGVTIRKGEVVTTGTCMTPLAIEPGDRIAADYGPLGTVAVSFVA